jgi:four helix bundle protein
MLKLIDLEVYKTALEIGERVWVIVDKWDYFNKDTLGKQFVRAADSISLNIAEGYGRFFYKENKNFNYYSRGSAFESTTCLRKAFERNLISEEQNKELRNLFAKYFKLMNGYIKSIGESSKGNLMSEDAVEFNNRPSELENFLTNDSLTNDH